MNMPLPDTIPHLADVLLKGGLLTLAAAALLPLLERRVSAGYRALILRAVFAVLLVLPFLWSLPVLWTLTPSARAVEEPAAVHAPLILEAPPVAAPQAPHTPSAPPQPSLWQQMAELPWPQGALALWCLGVCGIVGYGALGRWGLRAYRRRSRSIDDAALLGQVRVIRAELGIRRSPELRESAQTSVPIVWGLVRPVILLPQSWRQWPDEERTAALRHELGHLRNGDVWGRAITSLACALHWANPLAWLLARHLRLAQEQACDDLVITRPQADAELYARQLLETARGLQSPSSGSAIALSMISKSTLEQRLRAIVDQRRNRAQAGRTGTLVSSCCVGVLVVVLGGTRLVVAENAPPTTAAPTESAASTHNESQKHVTVSLRLMRVSRTALNIALAPLGRQPNPGFINVADNEVEPLLAKLGEDKDATLITAPTGTVQSGQAMTLAMSALTINVTPVINAQGKVDLDLAMDLNWPGKSDAAAPPGRHSLNETIQMPLNNTEIFITTPGPEKWWVYVLAVTVTGDAAASTTETEPVPAPRRAATIIDVASDGQLSMNGAQVSHAALPEALKGVKTGGHAVIIRASELTEHKQVLAVLEACRKEGIVDIAFAVTKDTADPVPSAPASVPHGSTLILPKVEFKEVPLTKAVEWIAERSREIDPEKKGVNVVIQVPPDETALRTQKLLDDTQLNREKLLREGLASTHPSIRKLDASIEAYTATLKNTVKRDPAITLVLSDIPASEALRYVGALAGGQVEINEHAILIRLK